MANTTNLVMPLVDSAQSSKEATIDSALQIVDNVLFVRRGTLAARPASLPAGALYVATDVGNEGLYYSSAPGTWVNVSPGNGVHVNWGGGTIPTAVAGAQAGAGPPAPVVIAGSTDVRGRLTFGTGTAPAAGAMAVVTFAVAYAAAPFVFVNARSGVTLNTGAYFGGSTTTGFTVSLSTTPLGSQGSGVYDIQWVTIGS